MSCASLQNDKHSLNQELKANSQAFVELLSLERRQLSSQTGTDISRLSLPIRFNAPTIIVQWPTHKKRKSLRKHNQLILLDLIGSILLTLRRYSSVKATHQVMNWMDAYFSLSSADRSCSIIRSITQVRFLFWLSFSLFSFLFFIHPFFFSLSFSFSLCSPSLLSLPHFQSLIGA